LISTHHNVAPLGLLTRLFRNYPGAAKGIWGLGVFAFLGLQWRNRGRPASFQIPFQLGAILILNPLVWDYWVILLLPQLRDLCRHYDEEFRLRPARMLTIALVLAAPFTTYSLLFVSLWLKPAAILIVEGLWLRQSWRNS
jgi:hypothetical protein